MWNTLLTLLLRDILLPKTFHNSALRSRFFLFVCLALFRLRIFSSIFSIFSLSVRHMSAVVSLHSHVPTLCHPMDCKPTSLFCSQGFSSQEYWSGLPCSPSGDLPDPEMEFAPATAPALQADSLPLSEKRSCIRETHFNYEDS